MSSPSSHLRVKVPFEPFVPAPKQQIVESLLRQVPDEQQRRMFGDFCRLIEGIYHFEYHATANELKQDFRLFNTNNGSHVRDGSTPEQLAQAEDRFLFNFKLLMEKGNFRLLTQEDITIADAEDYLFTLPVQTDWQRLDSEMLSRFLEKNPYGQGEAPQFAHRILIYQRGVGEDRTRGFLIIQKIDLLISNCLLAAWRVCQAVGSFTARLLGLNKASLPGDRLRPATISPGELAMPAGGADETALAAGKPPGNGPSKRDELLLRAQHLLQENSPQVTPASPAGAGVAATETAGTTVVASSRGTNHQPQCVHEERFIQRVTLQSTGVTPLSLFRRTELVEPTFKELILLFRFAPRVRRGRPPHKDWAIHIKAFRDIPMADLEVVFPEKRISMKPLDLVKLVLTGSMGVGAALTKLFVAALSPFLAAAVIVSMFGYAAKIFFGFKASKDRYHHLVTDSLYHKNLDNDLGVIFYLMDSLEEQEFKEAVLGYFVLWQQGPMTQQELDRRCECWLQDQLGEKVDFEIEDALRKLLRDDLATCQGDRYAARPLAEALKRLDGKWDGFFRYHSA